MRSADHVIVVTGAARGMGRACVERLMGHGQLVAVDLAAPGIEGATGFACDVSDVGAVAAIVEHVREMGTFRTLVHAAGISPTMANARRVFEVDLVGTQILLDAFEPLVQPGSSAVCFASSSAHFLTLGERDTALDALIEDPMAEGFLDRVAAVFDDSGLAYAWAKRGVIRSVARSSIAWARGGGRVNSVSPGLIDTDMNRQEFEHQPIMRTILDNTPIARLGLPAEVADVVAFLVSDQASFISGTDVLIDGGSLEGLRRLMAPTDVARSL